MPSQITDNFESYSAGELNGAGSWVVGAGNGQWEVQTSVVKAGTKAVYNTLQSGNCAYRTFTGVATGSQVVYMNHNSDTVNVQIQHAVFDTTPANTGTTFGKNDGAGGCIGAIILKRTAAGVITARTTDQVTAEPDIVTSLSLNTWYKVEVEWSASQSANGSIRGRIDDGTWGAWFNMPVGNAFATISAIALGGNIPANTGRFDEYGEPTSATVARRRMLMGIGT